MDRQKTRVIVADDHRLLTEALAAPLKEHFELAGVYQNGRELLSALKEIQADVAVLDISMPGLNGFETARQLRNEFPRIGVVFLTVYGEAPIVAQAFQAGANGFVSKRDGVNHLIAAIESVAAGQQFVSPSVPQPEISGSAVNGSGLTHRQREVLQLVVEGKSAKEIGSVLKISAKTVEYHKATIMDRLRLRTTAELVRYAIEHSIVIGEQPAYA
jgi:DNA-binding NarL/FixJ family response regulator